MLPSKHDIKELIANGFDDFPALLMDRATIIENVKLWRACLPQVQLSYAVKANSDPLVVELLANERCCFDVASSFEMELVAKFGVDGNRMLLSHPVKTEKTIQAMKKFRPWAFAVDSTDELDRVAKTGVLTNDYDPVLFVRIATPFKNTQDNLSAKFGCSTDKVVEILGYARNIGMKRLGLSFHVGTQSNDATNYTDSLDKVADLIQKTGFQIEHVDIGGGFGDRHKLKGLTTHEAMFHTISAKIEQINPQHKLKFVGEPGRFLVADAGTLVVRVLSMNRRGNSPRMILNDHVYGSFNGQEFDSRCYESFEQLKEVGDTTLVECDAFGNTCDSVDRLKGHNNSYWLVPNSVTIDDVLLFPRMGAYSATSGASFNGIDPAGVVMLWRDDAGALRFKKSPFFERGRVLLNSF